MIILRPEAAGWEEKGHPTCKTSHSNCQ